MKLCVGIRDIAHLREVQAARLKTDPPLRHYTRNFPRRAQEIVDGGSMYWVVAGAMVVRQRVTAIVEDTWDDGTACARIELHKQLVPVAGRPTKPFQGWRYLAADAAPPDLTRSARAKGEAELPADLQKELRALGLL
ncbi:DUF1489 family protein [Limobrevibacterium gyesilva]|uniref:DUF1489 domain-containing protein n=1 Tax=Limobrevibacterium gyesilva TaxID=2991712 RepID=A0AA41YII1_9PROT|nr:DUF1489 domain-containing protein [Limobrevibacterium gyesilva]MCW3473679.1 DUF1489 domain-containing protein [Limobrevibacterium gyesilva]